MNAGPIQQPFGKQTSLTIQGNTTPGSFLTYFLICLLILIFIGGVFFLTQGVVGQSGAYIISALPDQFDFPTLSIAFKIFDVTGQPVHQVIPDQISIIENDIELPAEDIKTIRGRVHFILAINADKNLSYRDATGISSYEYLIGTINNWKHPALSDEADSWSFLVNQGKSIAHLGDMEAWHALIKNYQPNFRETQKSLNSLQASIDLAKSNPDQIHTDQVLLYITPVPAIEDLEKLANLTQAAIESGLHINVWMVGNQNDVSSPRGQALVNLSRMTGGSFYLFPALQAIPNPQNYLDAYGTYFKASYRTRIIESGTHTSAIQWQTPVQSIASSSTDFQINVLAPKPIFLSPPINIVRSLVTETNSETAPQTDIKILKMLIEFPDGHPRGIKSLQLYQDGNLVSETTSPPFGSFDWDLSGIIESRLVFLQLRLVDELGLQASSVVLPVNVTVTSTVTMQQNTDKSDKLTSLLIFLSAGFVLSGAVVRLVLHHNSKDHTKQKPTSLSSIVPEISESQKHHPGEAKLLWLDDNFTPLEKPPVWLGRQTTTIGSDRFSVNIYLNHPSLNEVHAKIEYNPNGSYHLSDLDTVAGTWVNFSPVNREGTALKNLDLIHFGKMAFRFSLDYTSNNEKISPN